MRERRVVIVAFEGVQPLDAVGPHEVFAGATRAAAAQGRPGGYEVAVASVRGGPVHAESGLELGTVPLPDASEGIDTLVLAGGSGANAAAADEALVAWIAATAPRCRRVATVCSGAFLAAAAGLLEGRRVTTHWARARELRETYPGLDVVATRCGLGSAETLRRVFQRHLGVSPDAYRRRFRTAPMERTPA